MRIPRSRRAASGHSLVNGPTVHGWWHQPYLGVPLTDVVNAADQTRREGAAPTTLAGATEGERCGLIRGLDPGAGSEPVDDDHHKLPERSERHAPYRVEQQFCS
jgi:hypothetical protein